MVFNIVPKGKQGDVLGRCCIAQKAGINLFLPCSELPTKWKKNILHLALLRNIGLEQKFPFIKIPSMGRRAPTEGII